MRKCSPVEMMATRCVCACVDIGTNTTRLLVAERDGGRLREVAAVRALPAPASPATGGAIPPDGGARGWRRSWPRTCAVARDHGVRDVRVVGTAAIRAARQPRRALRGRAARRGRARRGPHRRAGGARWPSPGRWRRCASPRPGSIGVDRRRRRLVRARDRHRRRRRRRWWTSLPIGSGMLADAPPALRPAGSWTSSPRSAPRSTSLLGRRRPARDRARPRRRRQRHDAAAACGGELVPATIARILARPARRAGRRGRQAAWRCTSSACGCCPPGCWSSRRPGARSARRRCRSRGGGLREGVVLRAIGGRS